MGAVGMSSDDIAPKPPAGSNGSSSPPGVTPEPRAPFAALARGKSVGGRYLVLDELGRGGMAIVYRAYDPELDRLLALKLILHRDEEALASERLLREAQALAQLSHPNVVAVYDVGTFGSSVFIAMELVEGRTLRSWLRQKARSTDEIIDHFLAAGEGLAAAHRARIVHRDFKPANVLLGSDGRVRVADFGLARSVSAATLGDSDSTPRRPIVLEQRTEEKPLNDDDTPSDTTVAEGGARSPRTAEAAHGTPLVALPREGTLPSPTSLDRSGAQLTAVGAIMGTPEYMSPEQNRGGPVDELSDQYSYCVSLFEAFFGRRPLDGEDARSAARRSSVRTSIPRRVRTVLTRGLSTARENRFPSMEMLLAELRAARQRRRPWWPAVLAVAAIAAATIVTYRNVRQRQEMLCRGASAKMAGSWNADRRNAIHETFRASGLPYAEHAFATVSAVLDDYAGEWASAYTEACQATRLRGEQSEDMLDRRMACLEQRRMELDATADVLSHADRTVLENATQTAKSLASVNDCGDLGRLAARVMPPDAITRAQVERSWGELGRAKALYEAGRYAEGEPLARAVVAQSESLRYLPLQADAKLTLAQFLDAKGAYDDAEHMLRQALRSAQVSGMSEVSAAAWIDLVRVVGVRLQRHADAHEWARDAEAHLEALPGPTATLGRLLSAESALSYQEGKLEQAARTGERARSILERTLGAEAAAVADVLKTIGNAQADLGNDEQARLDYEQARSIWEKALGPSHPAVAAAWNNLGNLLLERGSYDGALGHYRQALEIWEASLGSDHPNVAIARTNIGEALRALGDREGAAAAFRAALSIRARSLGADHPLSAGNLANLGSTALDAGNYVEAERWYEQALGTWQARLGPRDLHVATALVGLGDALIGQRKFARATAVYERALSINTEALGKEHPDLAEPLAGLGQACLGLHQHQRARETLERALSLVERRANDPALLATVRLALAQTLWHLSVDRGKVRALAEAARDDWAKVGRRGERGLRDAVAFLTVMQ
jgi:serine/threonine protein kinase/tetratricopeptide (TPR) repeat protein